MFLIITVAGKPGAGTNEDGWRGRKMIKGCLTGMICVLANFRVENTSLFILGLMRNAVSSPRPAFTTEWLPLSAKGESAKGTHYMRSVNTCPGKLLRKYNLSVSSTGMRLSGSGHLLT